MSLRDTSTLYVLLYVNTNTNTNTNHNNSSNVRVASGVPQVH